jgi:hypothetical protein
MTHANDRLGTARGFVPLALTGLAVTVVATLVLSRSFYDRTAADIFFSLTLASAVLVFVHVRPISEIPWLAIIACVLTTAQIFVLKVPLRWFPLVAWLGVSSFLLLILRRLWSATEQKELLKYAIVPPLLLVLLGYFSSTLLEITDKLHPKTYDLFLFFFDGSLGVQPSFKVGHFVLRSRWLTEVALLFYYGLPIPGMLVYAKQLVRQRSYAITVFLGLLVAGPVGVLFYNLLPACGPIYLVGSDFPFHAPASQLVTAMVLQPIEISGIRNAFPSLHMGWALLAWWYSEGLSRWTRFALFLFLAGTVLATLGLGEHYLVDLAAAFPFALLIEAGCALLVPISDRRRSMPFFAALLMLFGWLALLRFGMRIVWLSPLIPWTLIVGTIISCLALRRPLQRAVKGAAHKT